MFAVKIFRLITIKLYYIESISVIRVLIIVMGNPQSELKTQQDSTFAWRMAKTIGNHLNFNKIRAFQN